jgi:hypothetical protein
MVHSTGALTALWVTAVVIASNVVNIILVSRPKERGTQH